MRIGLVGPAEEDPSLLREAGEFLLNDCGVEQAIYLGLPPTLDKVLEDWGRQVMLGSASEARFLEQAVELALGQDSKSLDALLERDRERQRLAALRCVPASPARAVELFDDGDVHKPNAAAVAAVVAKAREKGLILLSCGTYGNVLRVLVPLTAPDEQLDKGLAIIEECFSEL